MKAVTRFALLFAMLAGLFTLTLSTSKVVQAASLYVNPVTGGDAGDCQSIASPCSTIGYALRQASPGDTINLSAGTYTNFDNQNLTLDKAITIAGAGPTTILQPTGLNIPVFEIVTDNVTLRDMTLQGVSGERWAVRVYKDGGTIDGVTFDNVQFLNNGTRGIELHNNTLVTNLTISDSVFEGNDTGIRLAGGSGTLPSLSGAKIAGATISNTIFRNQTSAAIQQGAGRDSNITGLTISNSTFENNPVALSFGELRNSTVTNSTFTDSGLAIRYIDARTDAAVTSGNVTFSGNTFTDTLGAPIRVEISANPLDGPLTISNNTFNQDVGLLAAPTAMIEVALGSNHPHSTVTLSGNQITLTGTLAAPSLSAHGILVRGGAGRVNITSNVLNGGSIGTTGAPLPSSGIAAHTTDATFGNMKPTVQLEINRNQVVGFVNGVSLYDSVGGVFGNVPAAASINISRNALAGNSAYGARSDVPNPADATCNWWGDASGPSGSGPGTGDAVSVQLAHVPWLNTNDLEGSCVSLSSFEIFTTPGKPGKTAGLQQDYGDILGYDQDSNTWGFLFDGSDVGLRRAIHGLAFDPFGCILLSFGSNQKIVGLGTIKPQDIVKFCPTSLGENTTGTFEMVFDGSDVGLESKDERIDALELLSDGRLLISISTKFSVPGFGGAILTGFDEDLIAFTPAALGFDTFGTWELYLDGSTVPGLGTEDIIGVAVDAPTGDLFVSTYDVFKVMGVSGGSNDVLKLSPTGGGAFTVGLFFEGKPANYTRRIQGMQVELP